MLIKHWISMVPRSRDHGEGSTFPANINRLNLEPPSPEGWLTREVCLCVWWTWQGWNVHAVSKIFRVGWMTIEQCCTNMCTGVRSPYVSQVNNSVVFPMNTGAICLEESETERHAAFDTNEPRSHGCWAEGASSRSCYVSCCIESNIEERY